MMRPGDWQLTPRQIDAAVALAPLWDSDDKEEMLKSYWGLLHSPEAERRLAAWEAAGAVDDALDEARKLMLPGLLAVEEQYIGIPRQWHAVFERLASKVRSERFVETRYTGLAQLTGTGAPVMRDNAGGERYVYYIDNHDIGLGVGFGRSMIDDGLFQQEFAKFALGLADSFVQTEEILHANVLNTGEIYNASSLGDGVPLFSQKHPYDRGDYANVGAFELNEAALEAVAEKVAVLPDAAGLSLRAKVRLLIVPIALQMQAYRLMLEMAKAGNPAWPAEGFCLLDFLTDPDAWFVKTSIDGLVSTQRHPFRLNLCVSDGGLALEGTQSYGMGTYNPRSCFASYPKAGVERRAERAKDQVDAQMALLARATTR